MLRYSAAMACALLGNEAEADAYASGLSTLSGICGSDLRISHLYEADVNWILGRRARALGLARAGLRLPALAPCRWQASGPVHRWMAIVARVSPSQEWREMASDTLRTSRSIPELWDEAERLAGLLQLCDLFGLPNEELKCTLTDTLRRLPAASTEHLTRFEQLAQDLLQRSMLS